MLQDSCTPTPLSHAILFFVYKFKVCPLWLCLLCLSSASSMLDVAYLSHPLPLVIGCLLPSGCTARKL